MFTRRTAQNTESPAAATPNRGNQNQSYAQQQQAKTPAPKTPAQPEVKPIVKPVLQETEANGVKKQKPEWQLRKIDPETKRLRQNARVKKVVKPRPANMVLHEMYPDIVYKIDEVASNKTSIYRVHFELNNKNYSGEGFSKSQAKQNACEQALKALLLERVAKEQELEKTAEKAEPMETEESHKKPATDDFPWGKLAAFALQKLMDSWTEKSEVSVPNHPIIPNHPGYGPGPYPGPYGHPNHVSFSNYAGPGSYQNFPPQGERALKPAVVKKQSAPRKNFPENPLEYNAVALFNQTWPNTEPSYDTTTVEGKPQHSAALSLEGYQFSASGKSKKEVKLQMAKAVISTLKGVKYPEGFTANVIKT